MAGESTVLIVGVGPTFRDEVRGALEAGGHDVVLVRSGEEALELLAARSVDCILLSVTLPGLGGDECRRIKDAPGLRDIPLILVDATEHREAMIAGLGAGADDYVFESSGLEVLKARVSAQLRRSRREQEAGEARSAKELAESRAILEAELERKNRQLQEASRAKSDFLASMSHELRTPLNAIMGFAELMHDGKMGPVSPEHRECLADILASARHLLQLINDALALAKGEPDPKS